VNGQLLFAVDEQGDILAANSAARALLSTLTVLNQPSVSLPLLLECEWRDILSITYNTKDGTRAFRVSGTQQILFGMLIDPTSNLSSEPKSVVLQAQSIQDESVPALDC
jgi:hypothetical protein